MKLFTLISAAVLECWPHEGHSFVIRKWGQRTFMIHQSWGLPMGITWQHTHLQVMIQPMATDTGRLYTGCYWTGNLPMYQFNVLYNHHIQASVIHPHQGEFIVEVSVWQVFCKNSDKLPQFACTHCFIGHKQTHMFALSWMPVWRNGIIACDTALTVHFSILTLPFPFPW